MVLSYADLDAIANPNRKQKTKFASFFSVISPEERGEMVDKDNCRVFLSFFLSFFLVFKKILPIRALLRKFCPFCVCFCAAQYFRGFAGKSQFLL